MQAGRCWCAARWNVLVRRALEQLQDNVQYYYRHRRSAAFCQMAAQTIDELKSAGVSGTQLYDLAQSCGPEQAKLSELALIYQGYETLLAQTGMDPSDRLELAAGRLEGPDLPGLRDPACPDRDGPVRPAGAGRRTIGSGTGPGDDAGAFAGQGGFY